MKKQNNILIVLIIIVAILMGLTMAKPATLSVINVLRSHYTTNEDNQRKDETMKRYIDEKIKEVEEKKIMDKS